MFRTTIITLLVALLFAMAANGQNDAISSSIDQNLYNECLAIMHDGQMLVDEYSPRGKCVISKNATGSYRVSAIELSDNSPVVEKEQASFMVGIRDSRTNTIWMLTKEPVLKINIEDAIAKCGKEDQIMLMTVDQKYSLSHHVIDIIWE